MTELDVDDTDLNDVFNDETTEDAEVETEAVDKEAESIDEETEVTNEEETEDAEEKEPRTVPIAALLDERRKVQELREELERRPNQKNEEEPDPIDDPEGYKAFVRNQIEMERLEQDRLAFETRAEKERSDMLLKHEDYDEMEAIFYNLAANDDDLKLEMRNSPNMAQFAYDYANAYLDELAERAAARKGKTPIKEEAEEPEKPAKKVPNLAKATAQASNLDKLEELDELDEMFADEANW